MLFCACRNRKTHRMRASIFTRYNNKFTQINFLKLCSMQTIQETRDCDTTLLQCLVPTLIIVLSVAVFSHLKLELLTQFPASNDEKISCFKKNRHIPDLIIWLNDQLHKLLYLFLWHFICFGTSLIPSIYGANSTRVEITLQCSALFLKKEDTVRWQ